MRVCWLGHDGKLIMSMIMFTRLSANSGPQTRVEYVMHVKDWHSVIKHSNMLSNGCVEPVVCVCCMTDMVV
jgi:hypothetical protein